MGSCGLDSSDFEYVPMEEAALVNTVMNILLPK
jgi:hypothetical protein